MKFAKIFSLVFFFTFAFAATEVFAQGPGDGAQIGLNGPEFKWKTTVKDFGKIPQGTPVTATFDYTNIGSAPIILTSVTAQCGCTVPEYDKTPVTPNKNGVIKATYNAANVGPFYKEVTVISNVTGEPVKLVLKGEVVAP